MQNLSSRFPRGILRFISGRLIRALISLILFQIILFSLIQALPANIVELRTVVGAHGEGLEDFQMLDSTESAWQQFIVWVKGFYQGELGKSVSLGMPVADILKERLPRTLLLLLPGTVAGFLLGIWLGKRIAWQHRGWLEFVATLGGTAFYTSFPPWLAFVMVNAFGLSLGWFPPEKIIDPMKWFRHDVTLNEVIVKLFLTAGAVGLAYLLINWLTRDQTRLRSRLRAVGGALVIILAIIPWMTSFYGPLAVDILYHLALPLATLTLLSFGETMLVMRATMVEAMEADHVPAARAKGMRDSQVRDRHVARIAILPVLARFILCLPLVIIGSFILERVFYWDGMGQILIQAAIDNDLPVLIGVLSVVGVGILLAHIIFDLLNLWLDPRQRKFEEAEVAIQGEI
jgi:peptide/nickel transport system permease protein